MAATPTTINELLGILTGLRTEDEALAREIEALEARRAPIRDDIAAVERTIAILNRDGGATGGAEAPDEGDGRGEQESGGGQHLLPLLDERRLPQYTMQQWARKLQDTRSQPAALLRIAQESGGWLVAREAKRIFLGTGRAKGSPKNIAAHIYHMTQDSGRFERVGPGVFRLLPAPE